jgi:hypothetical protein
MRMMKGSVFCGLLIVLSTSLTIRASHSADGNDKVSVKRYIVGPNITPSIDEAVAVIPEELLDQLPTAMGDLPEGGAWLSGWQMMRLPADYTWIERASQGDVVIKKCWLMGSAKDSREQGLPTRMTPKPTLVLNPQYAASPSNSTSSPITNATSSSTNIASLIANATASIANSTSVTASPSPAPLNASSPSTSGLDGQGEDISLLLIQPVHDAIRLPVNSRDQAETGDQDEAKIEVTAVVPSKFEEEMPRTKKADDEGQASINEEQASNNEEQMSSKSESSGSSLPQGKDDGSVQPESTLAAYQALGSLHSSSSNAPSDSDGESPEAALTVHEEERKSLTVYWREDGSRVQLTGSWDQWATPVDGTRDDCNHMRFEVPLPASGSYYFKFIVDDTWRTNPMYPEVVDGPHCNNSVIIL